MKNPSRREFFEIAGGAAAAALSLTDACRHIPEQTSPQRKLNISEIPTVELHRHLEAGMSPEIVAALATKNKVTQVLTRNGKQPIEGVDPQNVDSIRAYYGQIAAGIKQPDGFSKFLDALGLPVGVICTLEDLEFAAYSQITEQAAKGSIHTELRGSPYTYQENLKERTALVDVINAIRRGIEKVWADHGTSGSYTACFSRNKAERYGKAVVDAVMAVHYPDSPVGLDIAGGPEGNFPPAMFENLLKPAVEAGVPITVHAGEQSKPPDFKETPPSFIRDAVEKLGAKRIGHGTSLIADRNLWNLLKERGVCIECCPSANDALGYMPLERHPMKDFLDAGLRVTANTDDPYLFGESGVRDMLVRHEQALRLTADDILQMTRNGIAAAFISPARRADLEKIFRESITRR